MCVFPGFLPWHAVHHETGLVAKRREGGETRCSCCIDSIVHRKVAVGRGTWLGLAALVGHGLQHTKVIRKTERKRFFFWVLYVGQRLCIDFSVSRANFLTTLHSHLVVTCSCYFWSSLLALSVDKDYVLRD